MNRVSAMWRHGLLAGLLAATAACAGSAETKSALQIAIIPKSTGHEFWESVRAGAEKAKRELAAQNISVEIVWEGPIRENDVGAQVRLMEQLPERRVDAIILAPLDRKELVGPVANAAQVAASRWSQLILDLISAAPVAQVSSDNYEAGRVAARRLAELIGGKGNVILLAARLSFTRQTPRSARRDFSR